MSKKRRTLFYRLRNFIFIASAIVLLLSVTLVLSLRWFDPPTSAFMLAHVLSKTSTIKYEWVPSNKISKHIAIAAVASEDQRFPHHHGFDFKEIQTALIDKVEGGSLRGASTISQQVAKNLFLWKGRNLLRKVLEAYFTVLIELFWSKPRILEVYLNIAEMGPGIYGVQAASQHYYNKDAWGLSLLEASRMIAALPNPKTYRVNPPSPYVIKRSTQIQQQVKQLGGYAYLK